MLTKFSIFRQKHSRITLPLHRFRPCFTRFIHTQNEIRNIGIVAHIDAGKTTTTERILYTSGFSNSVGNVDDGTTIMDFLPEERKRGITIQSAAITFGWPMPKSQTNPSTDSTPPSTSSLCQINLIDTPGHVDFTFEVERSLSVLDGVVTIIDGVAGVQAQTRTVWHQSNQHHLPKLVFMNKLDRIGAEEVWETTLKQMHTQLTSSGPFLLTQVPLFQTDLTHLQGSGFCGVLDLIKMQLLKWKQGQIESFPIDSQSSLFPILKKHRHILVEQMGSLDDKVLENYLETENALSVSSSLLHQALSQASKMNRAVPILVGASYRDIGIQPLLDAIVSYLPPPASPQQLSALATSHVYAFVFKVVYDPQKSGYLCYARVYSGTLSPRQTILNRTRNQKERIQRIQMVYADQTEDVAFLGPGSIGILLGLKMTSTGDHLGSTSPSSTGCSIPVLTIPPPVMTRAIEPISLKDEPNLKECLAHVHKEDPSVRVAEDLETGQRLVSGMGELHLEIIAHRLHQLGAQATFGPLTIAYREMILEESEAFIEDVVQADVHGESEPMNLIHLKAWRLSNNDEMVSSDLQNELKGDNASMLDTSLNCGPLGYPLINLGVEVVQTGSRVGLHACFMKLLKNRTTLVEPMMRVVVRLNGAETAMAPVLGDLAKRKGRILEVHPETLVAIVPLAHLVGYASALRGLTAGYGTYEMQMEGYAMVPNTTN